MLDNQVTGKISTSESPVLPQLFFSYFSTSLLFILQLQNFQLHLHPHSLSPPSSIIAIAITQGFTFIFINSSLIFAFEHLAVLSTVDNGKYP
ncbi:hypothetical protein P8452_01353 [Trifolium repens]|nr:hypothetical protein P8452_01353 [Trifolium repens]